MTKQKTCECGCGEYTTAAKKTDTRRGAVKGRPLRFLTGHAPRLHYQLKTSSVLASSVHVVDFSEISPADIENLSSGNPDEAARVYDQRIRQLERASKRAFVEIGLICREMRGKSLYGRVCDPTTGVPFHSFEAWVSSALNVSRSLAFSSMSVLDNVRGVPVEELMQMSKANVQRLAQLSPAVQSDPNVIERAKNATEKEFVAEVAKAHPGQHLTYSPTLILKLSPHTRITFDTVIESLRWVYEVDTRDDALANLLAFYLDGQCEREGYIHLTNREAYEKYRERYIE